MQLQRKETTRGNELSTREYRKLSNISYSDIKLFIQNRKKFYQEKILGEIGERADTASTIMGDMVHTVLLEAQNFDSKFVISAITPPPGQMKDLCDNLYNRTVKCMDENGKVTLQLSELLEQAIQMTKYNGKGEEVMFKGKTMEKIVELFTTTGESYYDELRKNHGKTVVTMYQIEKAELIAQEMRNNPWTAQYLIDQGSEESHNELPVVFKYMDMELRGMIDRVIIDHDNKTITPVDIKSSWDIESFDYSYLKNCYYIQAAMYKLCIEAWAAQQGIEDYQIKPMKFLSCDTTGYMKSLTYTLTNEDIVAATEGFRVRGKEYIGLKQALNEIQFGITTGMWNISKKAVENNGHLSLEILYE